MKEELFTLQREYLNNRNNLQKKNEFLLQLTRYLQRVVATQHSALSALQVNEIIQDALLNILRYLDKIENVVAYAYKVVSQTYANAMKHKKQILVIDGENFQQTEYNDEFYELFKRLDEELESRLWAVIKALKPPHNEIMELRYRTGLKYREIGNKLDLPQGHVNVTIQRSLKLFVKTLKNEYAELYRSLAVYFKKQD